MRILRRRWPLRPFVVCQLVRSSQLAPSTHTHNVMFGSVVVESNCFHNAPTMFDHPAHDSCSFQGSCATLAVQNSLGDPSVALGRRALYTHTHIHARQTHFPNPDFSDGSMGVLSFGCQCTLVDTSVRLEIAANSLIGGLTHLHPSPPTYQHSRRHLALAPA